MQRVLRSYRDVLSTIQALPQSTGPRLVAIDGRGGSGKSTIARHLATTSDQVTIVQMDDLYRPSSERTGNALDLPPGSSFDWPRLEREVLQPLRHGRPAAFRRYDWESDTLQEQVTVKAAGVVVVEGCYSMLPQLAPWFDFTIWVECDAATCLERGIARSGEAEREIWTTEWAPLEDRYIEQQRPMSRAQLIIDTNDDSGFEFEADVHFLQLLPNT